MKKSLPLLVLSLSFSWCLATQAQDSSSSEAIQSRNSEVGYRTERGDNEFGGTFDGPLYTTAAFGGLKSDEARDRRFFMVAFRYGRTLAANSSLALQYTLDAIPLAVQTGNISQVTVTNTPNGPISTFRRGTAYGLGATPLGLQLSFRNRSRVKPFVNVGAGGLIFSKPVPLPDAGRFAYTLQGGGGVRILDSSRRALSLGLRFHHISNGDRAGSNRGLNQFLLSVGYSILK